MVIINEKLTETDDLNIEITLSSSGKRGTMLRGAHYELGKSLGLYIIEDIPSQDTFTVFVLMRAGLCFGLGLADAIENEKKNCKIVFSTDHNPILEGLVIFVDAVINSGDTILHAIKGIANDMIIATNVISIKAIEKFENHTVYATRMSEKSFIGSNITIINDGKGPDTGERLFNNQFYK